MASSNSKSTTLLLLSIILAFSLFISVASVDVDVDFSYEDVLSVGAATAFGSDGRAFTVNYQIRQVIPLPFNIQSRTPVHVNQAEASGNSCSGIVPDIRACQSQGVKVLLSINGSYVYPLIPGLSSPQQLSDYLWNTFLGGHSISRPFGDDAVFDGINFDIQEEQPAGTGSAFWADLATSLKARSSQVFLSASVPCSLFQNYYSPAIEAGLFDYLWVRFYNNHQCEYGGGNNADALLAAWNHWTTVNSSRILLGLPAAPGAARSGYIPPNVLISSVLPFIKTSPKYAGVVLWNTFYDQQNGYSTAIKNNV